MDSEDGSGSCKHSSKDANTTRKKDDSLSPLISLVDSDHDSRSETDIEIMINGSVKKSKSSSSVSPSSSDSLAEDFFLMDAQMLKKSSTAHAASPKAHGNAQTLLTDDKNDVSSDMFYKSEETDYECSLAPSLVSDVTHESSLQIMSPVQSPPIQVMERPGDFDPDRIPASVFSNKPSTAVDWSIASNESLFSIQIGNNSFSREQLLMMNGDMCKYEESYKSEELYRSGELYMSDAGKKSEETGVPDETMKDPPKENVVDQVEEKKPHLEKTENSSAVNRHSDGSSTSCQSFAFPIKKRSGSPLCHSSNCSWALCHCTWPNRWCKWPSYYCCMRQSCYCCRWPSCYCCRWPVMLPLKRASCKCHGSNCSWAFCYSWNSIRKIICSYSPRAKTLTNNARTVSGFESFKQQDLQPTDSENSPNARKASKNCWCCCSLPSCSCSSCHRCWCWTCWC